MLGTIKLPPGMKLMQANLPSSNYDTDKQKKEKESKRASALKSNDGLHKINEENEYEDQLS